MSIRNKVPSPRDFMRDRRPERFSDSVPVEHTKLESSVLEYHLDSITSRNQEMDFERFAVAIAQQEICPNLLPHSGPMGGGDSKVDSETYPVADQIAESWYHGFGREAAQERWAFAISAAADWRSKMKRDVLGIVGTGRGYAKVFFITNQFVRDKARADAEDELSQEHGIDIRILDRSWLVAAVLERGHEAIAVSELGVPSTLIPSVQMGPQDSERTIRLNSIEESIRESLAGHGPDARVVEEALEAAMLARSLDRDGTEVDGLFSRAADLAKSYGTRHQNLNAKYQWAWATFWWFENMAKFEDLYSEVEALALGSHTVHPLELLSNLWMCLNTGVSQGLLDLGDGVLQQRTDSLLADLERLGRQQDPTGDALHARTLSLQIRMLLEPSAIPAVLQELNEIVELADGVANFPFTTIAEIIVELGDFLGDSDGYDGLFDLVVDVSARREGELAAARLLLKRASQFLEAEEFYEAISTLGSALTKLYKDESRGELVRALYFIGHAYARVGLSWAARGSLISAASIASHSTWTRGEVSRLQTECCNRIKWLELELGRTPQALEWHDVESAYRSLSTKQEDEEVIQEETSIFDASVGMLFLRTDLRKLRLLEALPDALERLNLPASALALTFALGHEDSALETWEELETDGELDHSFFRTWRDQPIASQLPIDFSLGLQPTLEMESAILGCRLHLRCENRSPCVEVAESILAALESFFSTGVVTQLVAHEPSLGVSVRLSEYADYPFSFRMILDRKAPELLVVCRDFSPHTLTHEEQGMVRHQLSELIISVLSHIIFADNLEETLNTLIGDQRAIERSVSFTGSFVTLGNVLGHSPKTAISDWIRASDRRYPLKREHPWDDEDRTRAEQLEPTQSVEDSPPKPAPGGEPPRELLQGLSSAKHTDIRTVSLIRLPLWTEARWIGAVYAVGESSDLPPVLGLMFEEGRPATSIFESWRAELGENDSDEKLYISIVRGVSTRKPSMYRILLGANPAASLGESAATFVFTVYRVQTMEPQTSENLDMFLDQYETVGSYVLAPAVVVNDQILPRIGTHLGILKREIHVKPAWRVGRHDLEVTAILAEDDPFIPEEEAEVPVSEVLALKRAGNATQAHDNSPNWSAGSTPRATHNDDLGS